MPGVRELLVEQMNAPGSLWPGNERVLERIRSFDTVGEIIDASRESWNWSR